MAFDPRLKALARQTGVRPQELTRYVELQMITLAPGEATDPTLRQVRRIHRLRRDLGIDLEVVAIIVRLLDRIDELERRDQGVPRGHQGDGTAFSR